MNEPTAGKILNPVKKDSVINELLQELENGDKSEKLRIYLKHQETFSKLLDNQNIFDENRARILFALVESNPDLVYKHFSAYFCTKGEIQRDVVDSPGFRLVLRALFNLATDPDRFSFAADILLLLAVAEAKVTRDDDEDCSALRLFSNLFPNTGAKTKATLRQRKIYLEKVIKVANDACNYFQLYILMKTLGGAANVFEPGEYSTQDDENFEEYIHFSVDTLLHYAGIDDENGLHSTAEDELHELLKCTLDEPGVCGAHEIPFRIFKYYIEHKSEWNSDPFYHLESLSEQIQSYRLDTEFPLDESTIKELERHLEQLVSLVATREFLTSDFTLYRGSKKNLKICEIGVDKNENSNLDLHERQSLAERLIFTGTSSLHDIDRGWPNTTFVVANLGFVVSDIPQIRKGSHKRLFKTIPIKIPDYTISGKDKAQDGHAEQGLYAFLLSENVANALVCKFREKYGINSQGHKIYAVVLDLHGTYDMCLSCSSHGLEFQNQFRTKLINAFKDQRLVISDNNPNQLPVIIRYSSDFKYHYSSSNQDTKQGVLTTLKSEGSKRELETAPPRNPNVRYRYERDIKFFGANLLIHGKESWHSFWNPAKRAQYTSKELPLESWTAFTTGRTNSSLKDEQKKTNYTRLGQVETAPASEADIPSVGNLRIS